MKLALCQINPVVGDIEGNTEKILSWYKKGIKDGADLVIFPELALCGYPPLDLVEKKEFRKAVEAAVNTIASATEQTALLFGAITEVEDNVGTNVFNSAILCYNGKVQFVQSKTLLPNYDVFDEMRYFESAPDVFTHEFKNEKLGISICEDIWNDKDYWKRQLYPNDPIEKLMKKGASFLINISASPYAYGKRSARKEMLSTLCKTDKIKLAYVCIVGAQTELVFDGATMCFDDAGNLIQLGKCYEEDYIFYDTNEKFKPIIKVESRFEKEILNSLIYGVKEYCAKQNFTKAVVGLSGGIDSALVTYIAAKAIGSENVLAVLLPSKYSSEGSIGDSIHLANNLRVPFEQISIQPSINLLNENLKELFLGREEDITEENIQSRMRGLILMAISNKQRRLLLATGNKSEMAVGYATLYGDMCGGLAVIADLYKTDIYRIANYINKDEEIIPKAIISKAPSAELKPNQTDQDTLPPYDILDKILRMYLEENKEFNEIVDVVKLNNTVSRILQLVDKNEFKRRQAAPALRVSSKAFGYGRRYPIVQGWRK